MGFAVDGNWVDLASLGTAALFSVVKYFKRENRNIASKVTGQDIMNGLSFFPMMMLGLSAISSDILNELLAANKLTLSAAGIYALFSMLEDEFEKPAPVKARRGRRSNEKP